MPVRNPATVPGGSPGAQSLADRPPGSPHTARHCSPLTPRTHAFQEERPIGSPPHTEDPYETVFHQATSKEPDLRLQHHSVGQSSATRRAGLTSQGLTTV